jgi:hypothetical protein
LGGNGNPVARIYIPVFSSFQGAGQNDIMTN